MANRVPSIAADRPADRGITIDAMREALSGARPAVVAETVLIASYFGLRTFGLDLLLLLWLVAALVTAVVAPTSGLVLLAAIAPFEDVFVDGFFLRPFGFKPLILGALTAGIAARLVIDKASRFRPGWPLILAGVVLVGSGSGLIVSWYRFGFDFARLAAYAWMNGIAAALVVLACAAWVARDGERRPLYAAIGTASVVGVLSLASYLAPAAFRSSLLGWMAIAPAGHRLVELFRSPTSAAALVMIPATFLIAMAVLAPDRRLKLIGLLGTVPLLATAYLTYTRTVYIALWATAVIVAWRVRRAAGVAILVGGILLTILALPTYIQMRGDALGAGARPAPGQQLIASDAQRLTAWMTSIRMAIDSPLTGQGYRSYRQVGMSFGADEEINAPHNEWLRLFAENGVIIGLAGLAFAATTFAALNRRKDWLGTAVTASFVSIVLAACFNNPFLYNQVMIPAFVVTGSGLGLAEHFRRSADRGSPADRL